MNLLRLASGLIQCLQDAPPALRLRILVCNLALVAFLAAFGVLAGIIYWHVGGALP